MRLVRQLDRIWTPQMKRKLVHFEAHGSRDFSAALTERFPVIAASELMGLPIRSHNADDAATRDHIFRSAYVHVIADAAVSVLAIMGLVLARAFGWSWKNPLAGVIGALVMANWFYGLMRDTGAILLDASPGRRMAEKVRHAIEDRGDEVVDLHVWRVGPGHMRAVASVATSESQEGSHFYHLVLERFKGLSHVTIEVQPA